MTTNPVTLSADLWSYAARRAGSLNLSIDNYFRFLVVEDMQEHPSPDGYDQDPYRERRIERNRETRPKTGMRPRL